MGALSSLMNFAHGASDYMRAPAQGGDNFAPSRGARLSALLGDMGASLQGGHTNRLGALDEQADQHRSAAAEDAAIMEQAKLAGASPQEILTIMLDRKAMANALATNSAAANVGGGATRTYRGGGTYTAPLLGHDGQYGTTQTPDSYEVTGQRPISYPEQAAQQANSIREVIARQQAQDRARQQAEIERANRAREGLGWANHNERKRQRGFGTPGVGGGAMGPESDWEDVN